MEWLGYVLLLIGALIWIGLFIWYILIPFFTATDLLIEKFMIGALLSGFGILFLKVLLERIRASKTDRYSKEVEE